MAKRPNVLFIISDDHRYSAIGSLAQDIATGDKHVRTPALDSLAANGVAFRQTHIMGSTIDAVCAPSRAAILTGVNPMKATLEPFTPAANGLMALNPKLPILPEVLRESGYDTYAIGKWHNDTASFNRGFADGTRLFFRGMSDHWQPPLHEYDKDGRYEADAAYHGDGFSSDLFANAAVDFLRNKAKPDMAPFFLYLSFTAPHDPRTPPTDFAQMYDPDIVALPENFLAEHPFDNGEMTVRDEQLAPWPRTPEIIRQQLADYYGMISHMDSTIGKVLHTLDATDFANNTIVVYVADHGLGIGQHGLMGKQNLYDHSIRVPLIMRGPSLPSGLKVDVQHYSFDLLPTLCKLTDTPIPDPIEGQDLNHVIQRPESPPQLYPTLFAFYDDIQRSVKDSRWKLIRYYYSERRAAGSQRMQLFDLKNDPWEMHDLIADLTYQTHRDRLLNELTQWQRQIGDPLLNTV